MYAYFLHRERSGPEILSQLQLFVEKSAQTRSQQKTVGSVASIEGNRLELVRCVRVDVSRGDLERRSPSIETTAPPSSQDFL